jgi:hypothetical protein
VKLIYYLSILFFVFSPLYGENYGSVSGQVTSRDTGLGIPNVKVKLYRDYKITATDDCGKYSFKNLKPGRYSMEFFLPHPYCCEPTLNFCQRSFIVKGGENFVFNIAVEIGGSLRGVVYKSRGIPFSNATVNAFSDNGSDNRTKTNEDGTFFIGSLYPAQDYYVHFSHKIPGHSYRFITGIKVAKGECTLIKDFIFDFEDETGIDGYVKSSLDGKPLPDVGIIVCYVHEPYELDKNLFCGKVATDSNGYFCIKNLENPGKYRIFTSLPGPPPKNRKTGKPLYTFGDWNNLQKRITLKVKKGVKTPVNITIEIPSYDPIKKKDNISIKK